MAQPDDAPRSPDKLAHTKACAIVRLAFGTLQTIGATTGFIILIRTGVNKLSVSVVGVTGGITILSRIVFGKARAKTARSPRPFSLQH